MKHTSPFFYCALLHAASPIHYYHALLYAQTILRYNNNALITIYCTLLQASTTRLLQYSTTIHYNTIAILLCHCSIALLHDCILLSYCTLHYCATACLSYCHTIVYSYTHGYTIALLCTARRTVCTRIKVE